MSSAFNTQREWGVASFTLQVYTQTLKTLTFLHCGQESASRQSWTTFTCVGYKIIKWSSCFIVSVPPRPKTNSKTKNEYYQNTKRHQQPKSSFTRKLGIYLKCEPINLLTLLLETQENMNIMFMCSYLYLNAQKVILSIFRHLGD